MDYKTYKFSKSELFFYLSIAGMGIMAVSYLMYKSIWFSVASLPLLYFVMQQVKRSCIEKRKQRLLTEFREFLYSLIVCLGSGYSLENALPHVADEMTLLYPNGSMMITEVEHIHRRITLGESIEAAFTQFSERVDSTIISLFVVSLSVGIEQGGNLIEVLKDNSNMIIDQLSTQQEIEVITAEKQFELKFLSLFPVFLIGMLDYSSPDFMSVLYTTWIGRIGMTIAMIIIASGICLARELVRKHT